MSDVKAATWEQVEDYRRSFRVAKMEALALIALAEQERERAERAETRVRNLEHVFNQHPMSEIAQEIREIDRYIVGILARATPGVEYDTRIIHRFADKIAAVEAEAAALRSRVSTLEGHIESCYQQLANQYDGCGMSDVGVEDFMRVLVEPLVVGEED